MTTHLNFVISDRTTGLSGATFSEGHLRFGGGRCKQRMEDFYGKNTEAKVEPKNRGQKSGFSYEIRRSGSRDRRWPRQPQQNAPVNGSAFRANGARVTKAERQAEKRTPASAALERHCGAEQTATSWEGQPMNTMEIAENKWDQFCRKVDAVCHGGLITIESDGAGTSR